MTSGAPPTSSATRMPAWRPWSIPACRSTRISAWPATWTCASSTCSRPTPTPTTSRATGGSLCGGPAMDMKVASTIGFERHHSPLLQESEEDGFVGAALHALGPQPPNFRSIVELNRGPLETETTELLPLTPRQVEQRRAE